MFGINSRVLNDSAGTLMSAYNITSGQTKYSETLRVERSAGFMSLLATESKAGGAGTVDIHAEYSIDGTNFYRAYTTSGAALTLEDKIVAAMQNVTRWIVINARIARYMRFAVLANADSQVTLAVAYAEEF